MNRMIIISFWIFLFSCKEDNPVNSIPDCLQQKIDDFKQDPHAQSIIRIQKPGDTLYWFIEDTESFDVILSEDCLFTCVVAPFISEHICDSTILDFPQEIVWEK